MRSPHWKNGDTEQMRIALISDIHGNCVALEAVLDDLKSEHIDQVACLGDVASGGPQPCEVVARLGALGGPVVRGNMDTWCLDPHPSTGESKNARRGDDVRFWGVGKLSSDDLDYMRTFQATVEISLDMATTLLCYHGSPQSSEEAIGPATADEEMDRMLSGSDALILAGGHTHTQMVRYYGVSTILNPGSVGAPVPAHDRIRRVYRPPTCQKDREDRLLESGMSPDPSWAEYGVIAWENGGLRIELRRVPVDMDLLVRRTHGTGMPHADWWLNSRYGDGVR